MTPEQKKAADYAEILLAFSRGEKVEVLSHNTGRWVDMTHANGFNFPYFQYRIAPKPHEGWVWVNGSGTGMMLMFDTKEQCEESYCSHGCSGRAVLMREVTE